MTQRQPRRLTAQVRRGLWKVASKLETQGPTPGFFFGDPEVVAALDWIWGGKSRPYWIREAQSRGQSAAPETDPESVTP